MTTLALAYRPRTWADLTGQRPVRVVLQQMARQRALPPALLFSGPRGTGKTTTARILAADLNCEVDDAKHRPCRACVHCKAVEHGTSLDVIEIDAASNGLVGDIRKLRDVVAYSVSGNHRVVLLDEAHSMSREAFNALLKTLEEPPPQTLFVLLTTEPGKILDTVLSRCMTFEFRRVSTSDVHERLRHIAFSEGRCDKVPGAPYDELLLTIAERSNGGLRDAVMMLDQVSRVGVRNLDQFTQLLGESDFAPPLVRALLEGDVKTTFALVDEQMQRTGDTSLISSALVTCLRELLVLKAGGEVARQGQALEARRALLAAADTTRLLAGMRVLWDLRTRVRQSEDPRSSLDLAVVVLSEALSGGSASVAPVADGKRALSLADMQSAAMGRAS